MSESQGSEIDNQETDATVLNSDTRTLKEIGNMRKVSGQVTSGLFEEFRELWMDYESVAEFAGKVVSYQEYLKAGGDVNRPAYAEIHAIIGEIREDEEGTDTRTPLLRNMDQMAEDLVFYLLATKEIGILFRAAQGYILPDQLPLADLSSVAEKSLQKMRGNGLIMRIEDRPVALINLDRMRCFLEHNGASVFDTLTSINHSQLQPDGPIHLQSLLDKRHQVQKDQDIAVTLTELKGLFLEKFGNDLERCDFTVFDTPVRQLLHSGIKNE